MATITKTRIIKPVEQDLGDYFEAALLRTLEKDRIRMKEALGIDPQEHVPWEKINNFYGRGNGFFTRMQEAASKAANPMAKLLEAATAGISFSSFGQLLRYGVQNFMFDSYITVPIVYPSIVALRPSKNTYEWYAPMYLAEVPNDTVPGQKLLDSRLAGLDLILANKWVGRILAIDRQLVDDDQTGQIVQKASQMGLMCRYKEEYDVMQSLLNGGKVGYSQTLPGGGVNAFASNSVLNQPNVEQCDIDLSAMKDPLGNFMLVEADTLIGGVGNKFIIAKLLGSTLQPGVPGTSGETASSAASGTVGWTMAINPLAGLYKGLYSRFLPNTAWLLGQAKTSLVFQDRMPLEVSQEVPLAGSSFEELIYRWRVLRRYNTLMIDSRFWHLGSST